MTAGVVIAAFLNWRKIILVTRVTQLQRPGFGKEIGVACIARWHYAIEHINTAQYRFNNIFRLANTHQIARLVRRHMRQSVFQSSVAQFRRLTDCKPAHGIAGKMFNSGVRVDEVRIERRPFQYLYQDDMGYNFMNTETFEQIPIPAEQIEGVKFLKEGDIVEVQMHADSGTILTAEMPVHVILEVTYTEPGIKGDTATNTLKPATVETGAEVRVPLFINTGERIKIDTRSGTYVERAKE